MRPYRFMFSDTWHGLSSGRFTSRKWYTVDLFESGICWFTDNSGGTDGIDFENFREGGCAFFQGEEYIIGEVLNKYK